MKKLEFVRILSFLSFSFLFEVFGISFTLKILLVCGLAYILEIRISVSSLLPGSTGIGGGLINYCFYLPNFSLYSSSDIYLLGFSFTGSTFTFCTVLDLMRLFEVLDPMLISSYILSICVYFLSICIMVLFFLSMITYLSSSDSKIGPF